MDEAAPDTAMLFRGELRDPTGRWVGDATRCLLEHEALISSNTKAAAPTSCRATRSAGQPRALRTTSMSRMLKPFTRAVSPNGNYSVSTRSDPDQECRRGARGFDAGAFSMCSDCGRALCKPVCRRSRDHDLPRARATGVRARQDRDTSAGISHEGR